MSEQEPQQNPFNAFTPEAKFTDPGIEYKDQLQVRQLFAGIRVLTSTPTHNGMKGEIVAVSDDSSTFQFYIYLNNTWKKLGDVDFANYVDKTDFNAKGDIFVATANDTYTRRAVGDDDLVLTADSSESDGVKWASPIPPYTAGNISVLANARTVGIEGASAVSIAKKAEFVVDKAGTLTIKFSLKCTNTDTGNNATGRVYRNGSPVGTLRKSGNDNTSTNWEEFTEDISGWSAGDTCEFWIGKEGNDTHTVSGKWFRACASENSMRERPVQYVYLNDPPSSNISGSTNTWENWDLAALGADEGDGRLCQQAKYAEILMRNKTTSAINAGVREEDSFDEPLFTLRTDQAEPPMIQRLIRVVDSKTIERYSAHATEIDFYLIGFWL